MSERQRLALENPVVQGSRIDERPFDDEVDSISAVKVDALVGDRQIALALNLNASSTNGELSTDAVRDSSDQRR